MTSSCPTISARLRGRIRAESGAACSSVARRLASKRSTLTSCWTWSHLARVGDLPLESSEQFLNLGSRFESQLVEALENLRSQIQAQQKVMNRDRFSLRILGRLWSVFHAVIASTRNAASGTSPYSIASRSRRYRARVSFG